MGGLKYRRSGINCFGSRRAFAGYRQYAVPRYVVALTIIGLVRGGSDIVVAIGDTPRQCRFADDNDNSNPDTQEHSSDEHPTAETNAETPKPIWLYELDEKAHRDMARASDG